MGKIYESIDERLQAWIGQQHLFFVGTAPDQAEAHLNISPKGARDSFRVLGPTTVAYLDLVGSGIETISHLKQNGRIVIMFCAFEGPPKVVRLHGTGTVIERGSDGFDELVELFNPSDAYRPLLRSFVRIEVSRISDSCGFVVPRMDFVAERDQLPKWAVNKQETFGDSWKSDYLAANNQQSIDGIAGLCVDESADADLVAQQSSSGKAL